MDRKVLAFKWTLSRMKTTRTMLRKQNGNGMKDCGASPRTKIGKDTPATRQREDYKEAVSKFRQAKCAADASGEVISPHITTSQRSPQRS